MADLQESEIRAMGATLGLTMTREDLVEVTHRLNAFIEALLPLTELAVDGPEPVPAPVDPDRAS